MKPRTLLGVVLLLVGGAVILWGIAEALIPLIRYYGQALEAPLDQKEEAEQLLSAAMKRGVLIGAAGVIPFLIGSVLLKVTLLQRLRSRGGR